MPWFEWGQINKIDGAATDGLAGTSNSLAYRVHEIEKHFHSPERWLGASAGEDSLTPYRAISGAGAYGSDVGDEADVLLAADTPIIAGMVKFDLHRIFVVELSSDNPYYLRIVYGSSTMQTALNAGQYSVVPVQNNPTGNKAGGSPLDIMMPRRTCGTDNVWLQAKCATDNATVDFFIGIHEYIG